MKPKVTSWKKEGPDVVKDLYDRQVLINPYDDDYDYDERIWRAIQGGVSRRIPWNDYPASICFKAFSFQIDGVLACALCEHGPDGIGEITVLRFKVASSK